MKNRVEKWKCTASAAQSPTLPQDEQYEKLLAFFVGPRAENATLVKELFEDIIADWCLWRRSITGEFEKREREERQRKSAKRLNNWQGISESTDQECWNAMGTTADLTKQTSHTATGATHRRKKRARISEKHSVEQFTLDTKYEQAIQYSDKDTPKYSGDAFSSLRAQLTQLMERFQAEVPLFSTYYMGHMTSDISLPALLGALVALVHNPNQVSSESSRVGIQVEREAIHALCKMIGYEDLFKCTGHFTSGGTVANFEGVMRGKSRMSDWIAVGALARTQGINMSLFEASAMGWKRYDELCAQFLSGLDERAKKEALKPFHLLHSDPYTVANNLAKIFELENGFKCPILLVPGTKHYSWRKACLLLGLGDDAFWSIETDHEGKLSMDSLCTLFNKAVKEQRPIISIVTIAGTTELSEFDPIDEVVSFIREQESKGIHLYHHVDAAYGGFFVSMTCEEPEDWEFSRAPVDDGENPVLDARLVRELEAIKYANSVTIDPHKLGYTPYSSGCFIIRDSREYSCFKANLVASYLIMDKAAFGSETIEGSRSASGAVSCWITSHVIGLHRSGYGLLLKRLIEARQVLDKKLSAVSKLVRVCQYNQTNITCFCLARDNEPTHLTNQRTAKFFEAFSPFNQKATFVTSQTTFFWDSYKHFLDNFTQSWNAHRNTDGLRLVRCVIMNPFFAQDESHMDSFVEFVRQRIDDMQTVDSKQIQTQHSIS